jgi:hypothetical protein
MLHRRRIARFVLLILSVSLVALLLSAGFGPTGPTQAALLEGGKGAQLLIGRDDDNVNNPAIQPPDVAANQSLNNADLLEGGQGNDVLIGLLGSDVLLGGPGGDILVGGTEQGSQPNSDIIAGGPGDDVNIWAPGDGSDAFVGGPGLDAQVFGVIDRVNNIPTVTGPVSGFPTGVPTANVTGMNGFCTIERVEDPAFGYEFLVRFFVRSTGNLAVTIRVTEVEQVFCGGLAVGTIVFADLTQPEPEFVEVTLDQVAALNPTVRLIIR